MPLTIKNKFRIIMMLALLGGAAIYAILAYEQAFVEQINGARLHLADLRSTMLMLRRHEKDFLARHDLNYVEKFKSTVTELKGHFDHLTPILQSESLPSGDLDRARQSLIGYQEQFQQLVTQLEQNGLNPNSGLQGQLRNAVHEAEKLINEQANDRLAKEMLMLRRHEKDFLLREDLKYRAQFDKAFEQFQSSLQQATLPDTTRSTLSRLMSDYQSGFHALVEGIQRRGLTPDSGILGRLRESVHQAETDSEQLGRILTDHLNTHKVKLHRLSIGIALAVAIGMVLLLLRITHSILAPIRQLEQVMVQIGRDQNLTLRASEQGGDELADAASALNQMVQQIQAILQQARDLVQQVMVASVQMLQAAEETAGAVGRQRLESSQIATAIEQMNTTVAEVAQHCYDAVDASQKADGAVRHGRQIVSQLRHGIDSQAREMGSASQTITELQQQTGNIGAVLSVIGGIADQTNLLALNAAIEAARAGEQGRGFAVVADEVRTLASRTQDSTSEIRQMIEKLQAAAAATVSIIQQGEQSNQQSVQNADQADAALNAIIDSVVTINTMNSLISRAAEEQSGVSNTIASSSHRIATAAEDSQQRANETQQVSVRLQQLAQQLLGALQRFEVF